MVDTHTGFPRTATPAPTSGPACELSLLVVAYAMERELPRTLASLAPPYQRGIDDLDYEVIVLDNGSPVPVDVSKLPETTRSRVRLVRIDNAIPSPVHAINEGLATARGHLVGLMIDGARLASPCLLQRAVQAAALGQRTIISTLGFHLGPDVQMRSIRQGYTREVEDRLLEQARWQDDGYNLFNIAALAGSSAGGWFQPMAESNALFMNRALWIELGGLDSRYLSPGGGAVNLDTYRRACDLPDTELILLLGEGTFHQVHGGVATNAASPEVIDRIFAEYEQIRGHQFMAPSRRPLYFGGAPRQSLRWLERSIRMVKPEEQGTV